MGHDDFYKKGHKHDRHEHGHYYRHDDYSQSSHSYYDNNIKHQLLNKLKSNPSLMKFIIAVAILLLVIIVIVAILLLPLLIKFFDFLTQNGIQGVIDFLWKGSK